MAHTLPHSSIYHQHNASLPYLPLEPYPSALVSQVRRQSYTTGSTAHPKLRAISFSHPPAKYNFVPRSSFYSCSGPSNTSLASVSGILKKDKAGSCFDSAVADFERDGSRNSSISSRSEWQHSSAVAWGAQKSAHRSSISVQHFLEPLCPPTPPFIYSDSASISSNSSDNSPVELLTPVELREMDMGTDDVEGQEVEGKIGQSSKIPRSKLLGDAFELGRPLSPPDSASSASLHQQRPGGLFGGAPGASDAPMPLLSPAASLPQAPTFDSPSRFASNKQSFPSPIQAGFRTPVSKRVERPSSMFTPNPRIARTLTFGQEEKGAVPSTIADESASSSVYQTPLDESQGFAISSEQSQVVNRRPVPAAFASINFGPESPVARPKEERNRDGGNRKSAFTEAGPSDSQQSSDEGRDTAVRTPTPQASVSIHLRHNDSPTLPRSFGLDRKQTASPHLIDLERYAGVINMGEGLAGGPQRDSSGKKIDLRKWVMSDPLSRSGGAQLGEKKLGGFKHRFSQSMASLLGSSKGNDGSEAKIRQDERRRTSVGTLLRMKPSRSYSAENTLYRRGNGGSTSNLQNATPPFDAQSAESSATPPAVPARTTSHVNSAFLERQKRLAAENGTPIPYSPSMPVLSDSLRSSRMQGDARVTAWLSATQLVSPESQQGEFGGRSKRQLGQSRSVSFHGIPDYRDKPLPPIAVVSPGLSASQTTTATTTSAVLTPRSSVRTASQAISPIEPNEEATSFAEKPRKRSIPGWARLFGGKRSSNLGPQQYKSDRPDTPDFGHKRSQSEPINHSESRSSSSLKNLLKGNLSRDKLGGLESPPLSASRRSSGDWRKLIQGQADSRPVRQEEADFFASVITGTGPSASPATSTPSQFSSVSDARPPTPQAISADVPLSGEGVFLGPIMEQPLPTLMEAAEEEDVKPKAAKGSRPKRQTAYRSQATQTDGHCPHCSPAYVDYSGSTSGFVPAARARQTSTQTITQVRHSVTSLSASEISSAEDDVHIQTIVSSPVHSVPSLSPGTPGFRRHSQLPHGSPADSRSRASFMSLDGFPTSLQFPMPPGRSE